MNVRTSQLFAVWTTCILAVAYGGGSARAGYIFNDNFEADTPNSAPAGWTSSTGGDANFSATVQTETGNQFVHLFSTTGGGASRFQKTFGVGTPSPLWASAATVDYDIRFNVGNDSALWARLGANYPANGPADSDTDVFIGYTGGASGGNQQLGGFGGPISLGAWHHVQIQLDLTTNAVVAGDAQPRGTFAVFVDSSFVASGAVDSVGGFWGTSPASTTSSFGILLNDVGFGNWFGGTVNFDVDNVSVLVPEPSSCGVFVVFVAGAVMPRKRRR